MDNIRYQHVDTYRNFENGCKQTRFTFPHGIRWVRKPFPNNEYWTIVPRSFYQNTKWDGPFNACQILDNYTHVSMYDIDHHPYFDEFKCTAREALDVLNLRNMVAIFIKESTEITGLAKFGDFDDIYGPITYIQLRKHGIAGGEMYGIYHDPRGHLASPDMFGNGKWVRVDSYKASRVWNSMYNWVTNKLNFIDEPCPMILNCDDAYKVWLALQMDPSKEISTKDTELFLEKLKTFTNQFLDISDIKSLK